MVAGSSCAAGMWLMATLTYRNVSLLVCEDLSGLNGSITFVPRGIDTSGTFPLTLSKHTFSNQPRGGNDTYLFNLTRQQVLNASSDIMGNRLLARGEDPQLEEIMHAMPPLRHLGSWGGQGARVWTASRGSGVDAVLDETGSNHLSGMPQPALVVSRLPGPVDMHFHVEGIIDALPIIVLGFPTGNTSAEEQPADAARSSSTSDTSPMTANRLGAEEMNRRSQKAMEGGSSTEMSGDDRVLTWEMSLVPVPNGTGLTQPVFARFLQVNASTIAYGSPPGALYFDTFAYVPDMCAGDEALAGCAPASGYFAAMLDNHFFWRDTWEREGRMDVSLPSRPADTDGAFLVRQSQYALVLDMITRVDRCAHLPVSP